MTQLLHLTSEVKAQQDGLKQNLIALLNRPEVFVYNVEYSDQSVDSDLSKLNLVYRQFDEVTITG